MKKPLIFLFVAFATAFTTISCDDANNTMEGYMDVLCTVDGHRVYPELLDTFYLIRNMDEWDLNDGDRGLFRLKYFTDNALGSASTKWEISMVHGLVPVRGLTPVADVDSAVYSSAVSGLQYFNSYGAVWAWRGMQNINVTYYTDGNDADFKMIASGVSGDTLKLSLLSDIKDGDKFKSHLLTFDLSDARSHLGGKAGMIDVYDSLYTKIQMFYYDAGIDSVVVSSIDGGRLANPFKVK